MSKKTAARATGREDASHNQTCSGSDTAEDLYSLPNLRICGKYLMVEGGADSERKLMRALGIPSRDGMRALVAQLAHASAKDDEASEREVRLMLYFIADAEPRDQIETFLLAQMATTHVISMRYASRMVNSDLILQQDSADRIFSKATRAYAIQMEALKRHRTLDAQPLGAPRKQNQANQEPPPLAITHTRAVPMGILQKADVEIVSMPSTRDVDS